MDEIYVMRICGLDQKKRNQLHGFYRNLSEDLKIVVEDKVKECINKKNQFRHQGQSSEFHYACRMLAIYSLNQLLTRKSALSYQELGELTKLREIGVGKNKSRKPGGKESAIVARLEEITFHLKNGLSWPQLANYAKKNWSLTVSPGYMNEIYKKYFKNLD